MAQGLIGIFKGEVNMKKIITKMLKSVLVGIGVLAMNAGAIIAELDD